MYLVEDDPYTEKLDAYILATEFVTDSENDNNSVTAQSDIEQFCSYQLMFKLTNYKNDLSHNTDYWILTPENIKKIIKYENQIYESSGWQNDFCLIESDVYGKNFDNFSCNTKSYNSMARSIAQYYNYNYSAMNIKDIKKYVLDNISDPLINSLFNPKVDEFNQTYIYRSLLYTGLPISDPSLKQKKINDFYLILLLIIVLVVVLVLV